jgi:hypothetical protein
VLSDSQMRQVFERELIKGTELSNILPDCSEQMKEKWGKRIQAGLVEEAAPTLRAVGRRMNNFCIGSDPEFAFIQANNNRKTSASDLGLKPALAAGSDQNLRLAELRCWPSRSVVEHVAGIMASLRWMFRLYPHTRDLQWRAGAHCDGDGIGGHVHFGRKRPTRDQEIAGLDGVTSLFRQLNCFNNKDWDKRIGGDARHQVYGDYGDFRPQLHGYEYRTLPSWLCSPLKAFFVLTVAKLSILDPDLVAAWRHRKFATYDGTNALQRLALYYAGRDDDAWILKHLLNTKRCLIPTWATPAADFKLNWGFSKAHANVTPPVSSIFAACVRPAESEIGEITSHLLEGTEVGYKEVPATFRNEIPTDYYWLYGGNIKGVNYAGAGDLCHNLVGHASQVVTVSVASGMYVSTDLWKGLSVSEQATLREMFPMLRTTGDYRNWIQMDRNSLGVPGIRLAKKFLLHMGLFPLWTVDSVKKESYAQWKAVRKVANKVIQSKKLATERFL